MFCSKCGFEIRDNMKFCPKCGDKIIEEIDKTICVKCGKNLKGLGAKFCPFCGSVILGESAKSDIGRNNKPQRKLDKKKINKWFIFGGILFCSIIVFVLVFVLSKNMVFTKESYYLNDVGNVVFGCYEQDGDYSNGPEPIEWEILYENDEEMLLLSRYVLDCVPYNDESRAVTWENCTLRYWLNNDFYNTAFNDNEKPYIVNELIRNNDNAFCDALGGNDTRDNVFCISVDEIMNYYDYQWYSQNDAILMSHDLMCSPTEYAVSHGAYEMEMLSEDYYEYEDEFRKYGFTEDCIGVISTFWWLRTPGDDNSRACYVDADDLSWTGEGVSVSVDEAYMGVRPAIYIRKSR